jgi:hypothetical protein
MWWTVLEEVENGLYEPLSGDKAAEEASGFSFRRARLIAGAENEYLKTRISLRLEGSPPGLLDAYAVFPLISKRLDLWAGQMKIPSTYEVGLSSTSLDFASRSFFSACVSDWSLCRSPSASSPRFNGARAYLRDLGVAIKGNTGPLRSFFMVSNGFGANRFIGGSERKQEVFANPFGACFIGVRVSCDLLGVEKERSKKQPGTRIRIGGHVSWNNHPNIVLDDERTVLDVRRRSFSVDVRADLGGVLKLTAMYGEGVVGDDFDNDGKADYKYHGYELKAMVTLIKNCLETGVRYDAYYDESYENGFENVLHSWTAGLNYTIKPEIKIQLNCKLKFVESDTLDDTRDDVFMLAAQVKF